MMVRNPNIHLKTKFVRGFTLIEMSIVLVIIGLIVGGILVGQELVAGAKIRAQVSQITQIAQALNTFKGKYDKLPGDWYTGTTAFGLSGGNATGQRDDNVIDDMNPVNAYMHSIGYEGVYFFAHLVQAKLIPATYMAGVDTAGTACWIDSSMGNAGYYSMALNPQYGMMATTWQGSTWVWLGLNDCAANTVNVAGIIPVMTPSQAYAIDIKMDDGIPGTGTVLAFKYGSFSQQLDTPDVTAGQCVTTAAATAYNITNNTLQCRLLIKLQR